MNKLTLEVMGGEKVGVGDRVRWRGHPHNWETGGRPWILRTGTVRGIEQRKYTHWIPYSQRKLNPDKIYEERIKTLLRVDVDKENTRYGERVGLTKLEKVEKLLNGTRD